MLRSQRHLGLWQAGSSSATWSPSFDLRTQVDVLALTGHHILERQQVCVDAHKQWSLLFGAMRKLLDH